MFTTHFIEPGVSLQIATKLVAKVTASTGDPGLTRIPDFAFGTIVSSVILLAIQHCMRVHGRQRLRRMALSTAETGSIVSLTSAIHAYQCPSPATSIMPADAKESTNKLAGVTGLDSTTKSCFKTPIMVLEVVSSPQMRMSKVAVSLG